MSTEETTAKLIRIMPAKGWRAYYQEDQDERTEDYKPQNPVDERDGRMVVRDVVAWGLRDDGVVVGLIVNANEVIEAPSFKPWSRKGEGPFFLDNYEPVAEDVEL